MPDLEIITTHLHADFDCVASMVAARKLHPEAVLVFPGSQEKNVRDYLAEADIVLQSRRLKGLDFKEIRKVIVVDASTRERIGPFSELVGGEGVEFELYDHHPTAKMDIPAKKALIKERGATITIFTEIFREKGIEITPAEATLFALGLYEDTGALMFTSTRPEDYEAAAWLLKKGADLNVVSDYIKRELNAAQIDLLNSLLKSLEVRRVRGVPVAVATASRPRYVGDVANVAHKIMDVENLDVLFVLVRMEDRTSLVARSRLESVNAGLVAEKLGGGGHPTAASANIKKLTLPQTIDRLWEAVSEVIEPAPMARDMMIEQAITIRPGASMTEAERMMTRYDINGMPVTSDDRPVGLITRQIVEKAIHHGMADSPVSDFMISEFAAAAPDTPLRELMDIILGRRQKLIPVVDRETSKLVGLVTRGMALGRLYGDALKTQPAPMIHDRAAGGPGARSVEGIMRDRLPGRILRLFKFIAEVAGESGCSAYVAGGFVRDLLLRIENTDVDIVIEGDGIDFARKLAERLKGRVRAHEKFKTAVVVLPDGFKIDVATARIEYYASPGALPTVEMSALRHDLYRRDFTINAMAIRLNGPRPNTLVDFFGGQADLKDHVIRVLSNLSFVEDPTRAFRAVRFERRYGFTMGKQTLQLLKAAVKNQLFNRLSGARLLGELKLILSERRPAGALARMKELDLLKFIHPALDFDEDTAGVMDRLDDLLAWAALAFPDSPLESWMARFLAMTSKLDNAKMTEMAEKFPTERKTINEMMSLRKPVQDALGKIQRRRDTPPSWLYRQLRPIRAEGLLFMAAKAGDERVTDAVTGYMTKLENTKPLVTGDDVLRMGVPPSPAVRKILEETFAAQLDGRISSREEALLFAEGLAKKEKAAKG
ncbi:MAG: CBS domain-containing protein [Candidatus Nitrospinota bacterium M3_3B_026]